MLTVLTQKLANRIRLRTEPPLRRILVMRGAKRETTPPAAPYSRFERNTCSRTSRMDRQTLRDWVHRFNNDGADGLIDAKSPGRPRKLSVEQQEELRRLVEAGPDPDRDGVVRWRCVDLKRVLGER